MIRLKIIIEKLSPHSYTLKNTLMVLVIIVNITFVFLNGIYVLQIFIFNFNLIFEIVISVKQIDKTCFTAIYSYTYFHKSTAYTVIHLQFWAYGSWDSLFPISMSPNCKLMSPKHYF